MITSSSDIYRSLAGDALISAIAKIRIIDGNPSLVPEDGVVIYISKYPQDTEFEAIWFVWIIDFDSEPLDIVVSQIRRSFPSFSVVESGPILKGLITEVKTTRTELAPPKAPAISIEPYLQKIEERFEELKESIDDRMLLVHSGRPGRDGKDGRDGKPGAPGRDGKDLLATEASLDDLQDVAVSDARKGDVLTYDGDTWVAKFVEQRYGAGGGLTLTESDILAGLAEGGEPMGHADRTQSVMTFDDATRTLTIAPVTDSFKVWVKGKRFVFYEPQQVQIPDQTALFYIYISTEGQLQYQEDYFYWDSEAPTAYVYWDADANVTPYFADERHGIVLDWQTHEYLHRTRGAVLANGFSISNYTLNGTGATDSHAQFDLSGGTFFDEDLEISIVHSQNPVPNSFQQDLQGPARVPVFYKIGTTWKIDAATNFAFKSGTLRPYYNSLTIGSWGLTEIENNRFVNYYIVATHNLRAPIISLMGQSQYVNLADAQLEAFTSLNLSGFPSREFRFLYKVTLRTGNYGNSVKAIIASIQDLRSYSDQFIPALDPTGFSLDDFEAPQASISMNNFAITNLANPVDSQDAATKNYVDNFMIDGGQC